jgi:hypothetical protein
MLEAQLIKRYEAAKTRRSTWEGVWQEIFDYTMPGREGFRQHTPGTRRDDLIFDETAVVGVQEFASRMLQGIAPDNMRWLRFEPGAEVMRTASDSEIIQLQGQLNEVRDEVFRAIRNSNFQQEAHESFQDLAIGTGNLVINDGDAVHDLKCNAVGLHEVYLEPGPFDTIGARFRVMEPLIEDVKTIWPEARETETMRKDREGKRQAKDKGKIKVLVATYRDWTVTPDEKHIHTVIDLEAKEAIWSTEWTGIGSCPWINFRWSKRPGEVYGVGPAYNALSAIKTVNLTVQLILENAEMAIAGMWQIDDDGVINTDNIRLVPGTVIPRMTNARGLEPLRSGGDFNVADMVLKDMRHNINRALYNETLGRREGTPMSATETAERMAELNRQIGAPRSRLQEEFVFPVVRRVVYLLKQAGRIELPTLNGKEIKMVASSPLVRAQRNEDISQHVNYAAMLGQLFGPAAPQTMLNPTKFSRRLADWYEIDPDLLPTDAETRQNAQAAGDAAVSMSESGLDPATTLKGLLP